MLLDTYEVLNEHNLLSTKAFARRIAKDLTKNTVSDSQDVSSLAMLVPEIRVGILGTKLKDGTPHTDDAVWELDEMIGEMTRPKGEVYYQLDDGLVLCSTLIRRKVTNGSGVPMVIQKAGRFVTDDAEVAWRFRDEAAVIRGERAIANIRVTLEQDTERIPALAAYHQRAIGRIHGAALRELPMPVNGTP